MNAGRSLTVAMLLGVAAAGGLAQEQDALQPLEHGRLVIWVIHPGVSTKPAASTVPAFRAPEAGFHEATPSTLGQSASNFGQTAGSYGVDASSPTISAPPSGEVTNAAGGHQTLAPGYGEATPSTLGGPSSNAGTTASSYGQTAGSFGTASSNHGQTAGSYGQTAGSFGHSLSTIADAGKPVAPKPPPTLQQGLESSLPAAYPGLKTQFATYTVDQLKAALKTADTTGARPDVLLFEGFPVSWTGPSADVRALEATSAGGYAPEKSSKPETKVSTQCLVLRRAPHLKVAQAFLSYLEEQGVLSAPVPER